jgi:hypothetical protein
MWTTDLELPNGTFNHSMQGCNSGQQLYMDVPMTLQEMTTSDDDDDNDNDNDEDCKDCSEFDMDNCALQRAQSTMPVAPSMLLQRQGQRQRQRQQEDEEDAAYHDLITKQERVTGQTWEEQDITERDMAIEREVANAMLEDLHMVSRWDLDATEPELSQVSPFHDLSYAEFIDLWLPGWDAGYDEEFHTAHRSCEENAWRDTLDRDSYAIWLRGWNVGYTDGYQDAHEASAKSALILDAWRDALEQDSLAIWHAHQYNDDTSEDTDDSADSSDS